jgi:hypothetical protein
MITAASNFDFFKLRKVIFRYLIISLFAFFTFYVLNALQIFHLLGLDILFYKVLNFILNFDVKEPIFFYFGLFFFFTTFLSFLFLSYLGLYGVFFINFISISLF